MIVFVRGVCLCCLCVCAFLKAWNSRVECAANLKIAMPWTGWALCDIVNVFISRLFPINFRKLCVNVKYCERKKWRRVKRHTHVFILKWSNATPSKTKRKSENVTKSKTDNNNNWSDSSSLKIVCRRACEVWNAYRGGGCQNASMVCWSDSSRIRSVAIDDISRAAKKFIIQRYDMKKTRVMYKHTLAHAHTVYLLCCYTFADTIWAETFKVWMKIYLFWGEGEGKQT